MEIVQGPRANTPGAIIQDDLGETFGTTAPLGILLEWHTSMVPEVLSNPPVILHVRGHLTTPFGIGCGPGAWIVSNLP